MGHTAVRSAYKAMLLQHLPARITALRAERNLPFVPTPTADSYYLADTIPGDANTLRILISSAERTEQRSESPEPTAPVVARYDLIVGVTVLSTKTKTGLTSDQAQIARDLIIDAITECHRMHRKLDDDTSIDKGSGNSSCGEGTDLAKRTVAIGEVALSITADEAITTPPPPEAHPTVNVGFMN